MKFIIDVRKQDAYGDYTHFLPEQSPFAGAFKVEYVDRVESYRQPVIKYVAKINEKGKPYISTEEGFQKPPKGWNDSGFNHRIEGNYYVKDVNTFCWVLDIDSLDTFISRFRNEDIDIRAINNEFYYSVTLTIA
jgi:hypothetical protein